MQEEQTTSVSLILYEHEVLSKNFIWYWDSTKLKKYQKYGHG